jgi:hypothetical protein
MSTIDQRIVRQTGGRDIPYIITGAGGYGLKAGQALAKNYTGLPSLYVSVMHV